MLSKLRTSKRLGWRNCAAVAAHRLSLRAGLFQRTLPITPCPVPEALWGDGQPAPMFLELWSEEARARCLRAADALLGGSATWFSHERHAVGSPPDWFLDPSSGKRFPDRAQHWSLCQPFAGADIKRCWELSRWGWAPLLARAWRFSGDGRYRVGLKAWIQSWCQANPVNADSNWLCGQETSMRLLHALQAWQLCDAPSQLPHPTPLRAAFAAAHLQRIAATERYAQAQDNNHWTSEAAALFIGGSWLAAYSSTHAAAGRRWANAGRRALERSVGRLVMSDGSFAQHSLTYHRLLLDTLAQVELWRRWLDLDLFSVGFNQRCRAATSWLAALVDPISGDVPNLGSNDGAFCYQLHSQSYRDFRPSLQLAGVLFYGQPFLPKGPWNEPLCWVALADSSGSGVSKTQPASPAQALQPSVSGPITLFPGGGYAVMRPSTSSWALLRLPSYRFRPAHADPLHLDLWHQGVNLLRDGGSYAYNAPEDDLGYFPGIASHNTVQFNGSEPMPRLGRFLWGDWLQLEHSPLLKPGNDPGFSSGGSSITAAYRGPHGRHQRQVQVAASGNCWIITDNCSCFQQEILLRWRLCPGDWRLDGASLMGSAATLTIRADQPIARLELVMGWESLHYGSKTPLPVLEMSVTQAPVTITTSIQLFS